MRAAPKVFAIGALSLAGLAAHADEAQLSALNIRASFFSGNLRSLRLPDSDVFRITAFFGRRFAMTVTAESNHLPSEVQRIQVQLLGKKSDGGTVNLSLFNFGAGTWERMGPINLPSARLGLSDVFILTNARRFVGRTGTIQVRYESTGACTMHASRLLIAVNP